jgi:hypothetical protein
MKLSFAQKLELAETGTTQVWVPPHRLPDDEVTWGHWKTVARHRGKLMEVEVK